MPYYRHAAEKLREMAEELEASEDAFVEPVTGPIDLAHALKRLKLATAGGYVTIDLTVSQHSGNSPIETYWTIYALDKHWPPCKCLEGAVNQVLTALTPSIGDPLAAAQAALTPEPQ